MSTGSAPTVHCEMQHPTLNVPDVAAAVDFYSRKLGFVRGFSHGDPPTIAGVELGQVSVHLRLRSPLPGGFGVYFVIDDADALHEFQRAQGVDVVYPPTDQAWGFREFRVKDLCGYELTFGHRIHQGPPLKIERVDVQVRLEKRLAGVLQDLAAYKKMTVSSCLEETLLHTFERVGNTGVASPHTPRALAVIQELKAKHGLDYDTHDSYRFEE